MCVCVCVWILKEKCSEDIFPAMSNSEQELIIHTIAFYLFLNRVLLINVINFE